MKRTPQTEQTHSYPVEWNTVPDLPPVGRRVHLDRTYGALYKVCLDDVWYLIRFSHFGRVYLYDAKKLIVQGDSLGEIQDALERIHGENEARLHAEITAVQVAIEDLPF